MKDDLKYWIKEASLTDKDMGYAILGFMWEKKEASGEEIDKFVKLVEGELIGARLVLDAMELVRQGQLAICEKDGQIAWRMPDESYKKNFDKVRNAKPDSSDGKASTPAT